MTDSKKPLKRIITITMDDGKTFKCTEATFKGAKGLMRIELISGEKKSIKIEDLRVLDIN
ncbi:MAG: hypothetical protein ACTSYR_05195 [Candidatus Odinarchaeia archaeon]